MRVIFSRHGDVAVMSLDGGAALDYAIAADVKAQAIRRLDGRSDLVIDLAGIEFIDSSGMGVLVGLYKRIKLRGQRVAIAGVQPYVARVLRIIKLDQVFESFDSVALAVEAFGPCEAVGAGGTQTPQQTRGSA